MPPKKKQGKRRRDTCKANIPEGAWGGHVNSKKHNRLVKEHIRPGGIHVTGYPPGVTSLDLQRYFFRYGPVSDVYMEPRRGLFALVNFHDGRCLQEVLSRRHFMFGFPLNVNQRREKDQWRQMQPLSKKERKDVKNEKQLQKEQENMQIIYSLLEAEDVSSQVFMLQSLVELPSDEQWRRDEVCSLIQNTFNVFMPQCKLYVFGSSFNGLATRGCDMDVFLDLGNPMHGAEKGDNRKDLTQFYSVMRDVWRAHQNDLPLAVDDDVDTLPSRLASLSPSAMCYLVRYVIRTFLPSCSNVMGIPQARCPVVKLEHAPSGLHIDITTKNKLGVYNSRLVKLLVTLDERVKALIHTVRYWAKLYSLSSSGATPLLSSYAVSMLVVFALQNTSPPLLPTVKQLMDLAESPVSYHGWECGFTEDIERIPQTENTQSTEELLREFFRFYKDFDFGGSVLCPLTGTSMMKSTVDVDGFQIKPLCIQDPFELNHNVAKNVTDDTLEKIVDAMRRGWTIFSSDDYCCRGEDDSSWGVGALLDPSFLQQRGQKRGREEGGNTHAKRQKMEAR